MKNEKADNNLDKTTFLSLITCLDQRHVINHARHSNTYFRKIILLPNFFDNKTGDCMIVVN